MNRLWHRIKARVRRYITARNAYRLVVVLTFLLLLQGASPIVIAWIVIAETGLYLAYLNGAESLADYQALGGSLNGRRTIAVGNMRREIVRGLIAFDFIAIGALVLVGARGVAAPGLILASAGMVLNSYLDRRDRMYLLKYGIQARDELGRFVRVPETQDQREDRQFGEVRRELEQEHLDTK